MNLRIGGDCGGRELVRRAIQGTDTAIYDEQCRAVLDLQAAQGFRMDYGAFEDECGRHGDEEWRRTDVVSEPLYETDLQRRLF
jgi:hypothetical protein